MILSEQQIEQIAHLIFSDDQEVANVIKHITKWNENQITTIFVEPKWDNAPKDATSADFSLSWYNKDGDLVLKDIFKEFSKPNISFVHAEIIAKYAQVAARRCDPWVEFEYSPNFGSLWKTCTSHTAVFLEGFEYRYIGDSNG